MIESKLGASVRAETGLQAALERWRSREAGVGHLGSVLGLLAFWLLQGIAGAAELGVRVGPGGEPWLRLNSASNSVAVLEKSADFRVWTEWQTVHGPVEDLADWAVSGQPGVGMGFYRARVRAPGALDDWKNVVSWVPEEPFLSGSVWDAAGEPRWIKFVILLDEPDRVIFQDSRKHLFHYDFARVRVPRFQGMDRSAFDAVTLRTNRQQAVLGAVLVPSSGAVRELGIQLVGLDAFRREQVVEWFKAVRSRIQRPADVEAYYLPTFEQAGVAREHAEWFSAQGVPVGAPGRWVVGDECYAPGWALGRLVRVEAARIAEAYRSGELGPSDILLTDAVPAEVPPLAGIVSLEPATPNSHVALLAKSFGIPFVHLAEEGMRRDVAAWTNREVMIRAVEMFAGCNLTVVPVEGGLPDAMRAEILALKQAPNLEFPRRAVRGAIHVGADLLRPVDAMHVGGKAAHFGILRRRIPTNSPAPAIAFTFDLWDGFLDQRMSDGRTLRESIEQRLQGFAWPPDMAALQSGLSEVRAWITDRADFSPGQREAVIAALREAGFPPANNIRFRSSTNLEDGEQFSGAGLYDSFSGCLADELDGDSSGPSACDPTEPKERGVFRALRKVYASFYNDNAYLERLRHRVDEAAVGMAVLVHPSTPDAIESANGVATVRVSREGTRYLSGTLVTQLGAVSVSNPDTTAVPERVSFFQFGAAPAFTVERRSSLVPLGGTVLGWDASYRALLGLLNQAALGYEAEFLSRSSVLLDFEYKRIEPGGLLSVKQIREVPVPVERTHVPWLLDTAARFGVLQGERGSVITFHRLKSEWELPVRPVRMVDGSLTQSVFRSIGAEWREGTNRVVEGGDPEALPGHRFARTAETLMDRWTWGQGVRQRTHELVLNRVRNTQPGEAPLMTLSDHWLTLTVTHAVPQPTLEYDPFTDAMVAADVLEESVQLTVIPPVTRESLRQVRTMELPGGRGRVTTEFWWPAPPKGPSAGYTAPLQAWGVTVLEGLTQRPVVLRSAWAQTYHPGHHNFSEDFLFEPGRDPEVPADQLEELRALNIKAVIIASSPFEGAVPKAWIWGVDERFRRW